MLVFLKKLLYKYTNLKLPVKASIWFTFCNLVLKGIGFITVPIFAGLLSKDEYGILSTFMSYEAIILTLATWETSLSAYQRGLLKYKNVIRVFTGSTISFSNILTVLLFLLGFIFFIPVHSFTGFSLMAFSLLLVYMLMQPAYSCWLIEKRTNYEYIKASFVTILYGIIVFAFPYVAIKCLGPTAEIKYVFSLLGSITVFSFFYFRHISTISVLLKNKSMVRDHWKYIISFQFPIVLHALSYVVLAQSDRIMIEKMVGTTPVAYYSVAYNIAMAISIIQNSINQALVPWRFEKLENKDYFALRKSTAPILLGVGLLIILFVFVAPEIIILLFDDYYEAIWCIPPVAVSVFFMFLYTLFVWVENYYEKTKYVAVVSIACALLNVLLNYLLIGSFGYIACAYTTLFSYIIFCFGHYIFMKRTLKECGVKERVYDYNACFLLSIVMLVLMLIATFTYAYPIVRYIVIVASLFIVVIQRKKIQSIVFQFKRSA